MVRKWNELNKEEQQKVLDANISKDIPPMDRVKRISSFMVLLNSSGNYYFDKAGKLHVGPEVEKCPPARAYKSYVDNNYKNKVTAN